MIYFLYAVLLISVLYAWISLAPWVPTHVKDLEELNKILKLKKGDKFVEMGCGNARVCSYIAKKNPEVEVVGIELAFPFYFFSKFRALLFWQKNLKIIFGDALKYDISDVDVVYVFGLTDTINTQIKNKIMKEMKKDGRLVSYVFEINKWEGECKTHRRNAKTNKINIYSR